jgi:hypothetical protein
MPDDFGFQQGTGVKQFWQSIRVSESHFGYRFDKKCTVLSILLHIHATIDAYFVLFFSIGANVYAQMRNGVGA